ncbi:MAG: hypothetical protein WCI47_01240 [bacterium]
MKQLIRRHRRAPKNLVHDMRTIDELLDEMATKWALKAERLQSLKLKKRQTVR